MKHQLFRNHLLPFWALSLTLTSGLVQQQALAQTTAPIAAPAVCQPTMTEIKPEGDDQIHITMKDMAPDELATLRKEFAAKTAANTRKRLGEAGFTNSALQEKIIAFEGVKYDQLNHLYDAYVQLTDMAKKPESTDAQISAKLEEFRAAMDKESQREQMAWEALNQDINIEQRPKLEALLVTLGITTAEGAIASQGGILGDMYAVANG